MAQTIAILHYASPPTVGGVESTILHHARGLTMNGYCVRVLTGSGGIFTESVNVYINPRFGSTSPEVLAVKRQLDTGDVTHDFHLLVDHIVEELRDALDGVSHVIAHNVPTFNKNLPLTAALAKLHREMGFRLIVWAHDLAWTNEQYASELHDRDPWNLLRRAWDGAIYVTVSEARRAEAAALLNLPPEQIHVVTPGVDLGEFYHLTETTKWLANKLGWFDCDGILLLPARITRRKNIALALKVLAEVRRQSTRDYRLIVTGPPGPHNPANPGYLGELLELRRDLYLEDAAHFLYSYGVGDAPLIPDDATLANLYHLADALFFPPLSEGFGIPMIEAGLARLPIFCSDIPPLRGTAGEDAHYFDPVNGEPDEIAALILRQLGSSHLYHMRLKTRREFRWEAIIQRQVIPLLETE